MNDEFINSLISILSDRISFAEVVRSNYSKGEDIFDPVLPAAVVFQIQPKVSSILKLCNQYKIPVIPFGAGTSLKDKWLALKKE